MFGIGSTELLLILIVALLVLGPKSLASTARTVGKVMGQFRRVSTDFQRTLNAEVAMEEEKEKRDKVAKEVEADLQQPAANAGNQPGAQTAAQTNGQSVATSATVAGAAAASQTAQAGQTAGNAPTAAKASAADEDDDMLAPPPGSPLDEALKKAAAEAANAAELMEPVTVESVQTEQTEQAVQPQDAPKPEASMPGGQTPQTTQNRA